jgi:two-component system nitrogen regulation response regulator GlnG
LAASILVIDDDRTVLRLIEKTFDGSDITVFTAATAEDGLSTLQRAAPEVLLLDIMLPEMTGLEMARKVREVDARLPIIFVTASDDSDDAIEAMKLGAYDYLLKPLDKQKVKELISRALENRRMMQSPVVLPDTGRDDVDGDVLVGRSPGILDVYKQIGRVAAQDVTVLIRGESGTGKELIARAIYQHSHRANGCFLAVNCAALSDTLLESELFGHEKGAFTGADRRHIGKFEQCNGGTIFLDEIGDMSPSTQAKVLRLLQEQKFERVGGTETIKTDVRIISATNADLETMIEKGEYRLDLYHRLNGFEIQLPPLRQRGDDVRLLVEHFMARFNKLLGKNISAISSEAMEMMLRYPWPGNIRELQSVIRRAILMATGPVIVPELLPREVVAGEQPSGGAVRAASGGNEFEAFLKERENARSLNLYAEALEWMERILITRVLNNTEGNQSKAAEVLGITRGSLRHKIRALGLSIEHVVAADE